ncbi:MAG TPA: NrfD/PsrC family molybdoenzyme membrane anchor subunit [Gaiellaceae bacterium]|nr:NrfD/PsrC family molybdoenzyme membrane anchor subunit [Gaiellaceae bacterium]
MTLLAASEHFAGSPHWTWYILFYFFLAGLAGGAYFLATLLRYWGTPGDEPVARLGFYVPFPATIIGLLLLTLDLKQPLRFWHMLFNTTPDQFGLNFNSRTPMSVGVWALLVASIFSFVVFVDTLVRDGRIRNRPARRLAALLDGTVGLVWNVIGTILYLFIAGYTGVLIAVSNQPIWSDSWALGGLFLASGLAGSAALLLVLSHYRPGAEFSRGVLERSEHIFTALELLLVVVVVVTLIDDGAVDDAFGFPWILLWLVALVGMLPGLRGLAGDRVRVTRRGAVAAVERAPAWVVAPSLVLVGVLALRAAVIFSAQ